MLQPTVGHEIDTNERRTGRRTDADPCLLRRTETEEQVGGAAGRTRGVPRTARASTKPAQVRDGAEDRESRSEREAPKSVRQHFVLSARDPLLLFFLFLL